MMLHVMTLLMLAGDHWFVGAHEDGWSDAAIGVCVLILALGLLIICLVSIVKLLHSLLRVRLAAAASRRQSHYLTFLRI